MKPTLQSLVALFRRHPNAWINHSVVYEAAGHRATARVMELRGLGFTIEQRGQAEASQYRMTHDPLKPRYSTVKCTVCTWSGSELEARGGGSRCRECDAPTVVVPAAEVRQEVLAFG